ncbi:type II secretion system protein N [Cedecea colo]|uniref:Type II secretion system protein N n=1 Tax=Cedecea colo TaxID=2552946 RepID=A0ABX0VGR2_9ENTR|nr:type II secretion system protein N [Cedecea colo]NIY46299.1 type II secretion system protein N [Cedecea colo]
MRRWLRWGGLFLLLYVVCLLVSAPARLLTPFTSDRLQFTVISGTLWQGKAEQLRWRNRLLGNLSWRWGWHHGLPVIRLALTAGEVGEGRITVGWLRHWQLSTGRWQLPISRLPAIFGYAVPLEGQGHLVLALDNASFNAGKCLMLTASVEWRQAQLSILGQTTSLGEPRLQLRCEPQRLLFTFHPQQPPLKLFGEGSLDRSGNYHFRGGIGAPEALPAQWQQAVEVATSPGEDGSRKTEVAGIWPGK